MFSLVSFEFSAHFSQCLVMNLAEDDRKGIVTWEYPKRIGSTTNHPTINQQLAEAVYMIGGGFNQHFNNLLVKLDHETPGKGVNIQKNS